MVSGGCSPTLDQLAVERFVERFDCTESCNVIAPASSDIRLTQELQGPVPSDSGSPKQAAEKQ